MTREGFSFNSAGQGLAFVIRMDDVARPTFDSGTNTYSKLFKHPTLSKWGYEVERNGSDAWLLLEDDLNPNDINNLITFDSSWFPNPDVT